MYYIVELTLPQESLHTLDPSKILDRIVQHVPGTIVCRCDYAQLQVDAFADMKADGAMRTAEADARRRGPIWTFRIYRDDYAVRGAVERRRIFIDRRDAEIPADLRQEFESFLNCLEIPAAKICSYRLEGNTKTPF